MFGTSLTAVIVPTTPIGTLIKKIHRQLSASMRSPPSIGPRNDPERYDGSDYTDCLSAFLARKRLCHDGETEARVMAAPSPVQLAQPTATDLRRQPGENRTERENSEAGSKDDLLPDNVAQSPQTQSESRLGEEIDQHHPLDHRKRRLKLINKGRQSYVDDRETERGLEKATPTATSTSQRFE